MVDLVGSWWGLKIVNMKCWRWNKAFILLDAWLFFFFDGFKRNLVIVYGVAQMSGKEAFVREFAQL
jgi:hypothetical protein